MELEANGQDQLDIYLKLLYDYHIHKLNDEDLAKIQNHDPKWFKSIIYRIDDQNYQTLLFKKIKRKGIPLLKLIYSSSPEDLSVISSELKLLAFKDKHLFLSFPSSK